MRGRAIPKKQGNSSYLVHPYLKKSFPSAAFSIFRSGGAQVAFLASVPIRDMAVRPRAFFGPWLDLLCMGGGSLIALPIIAVLVRDSGMDQVQFAVLLIALVVNFPHFIHSYQIFYGSFGKIVLAPQVDRPLRRRYLWSGIIAPAILVCPFAVAVLAREPDLLRYTVNAMVFFVGWHYVKQGYGMLMADAVMKRSFFSAAAKKCLVINAYLCWALSWLLVNNAISEQNFANLSYYTFDVPDGAVTIAAIALGLSSLWSLVILVAHARKHGAAFPLSGATAYVASLYVWLLVPFDPEIAAFIPAFHSLQYLYMVWRYRWNMEAEKSDSAARVAKPVGQINVSRAQARFATYILSAIVLGIVAFLAIPAALDLYMPYDRTLFGDRLFMVVIWAFINIHHYFIDNAMWRKENPHTMAYLFSHRTAA
jgi:hypothetical protein